MGALLVQKPASVALTAPILLRTQQRQKMEQFAADG